MDVLGRCGSFFSHDFGLPRIGSSSAVRSGSLDSFHFVPEHFFLLSVGLGFEMEWAEASRTFWPHNSPLKSCCPAPWMGRRILTFSSLYHGRLSLVPLWVPGFLRLPKARSWCFGIRGALSLMLFWGDADRFGIRNVYLMAPL